MIIYDQFKYQTSFTLNFRLKDDIKDYSIFYKVDLNDLIFIIRISTIIERFIHAKLKFLCVKFFFYIICTFSK